MFIDLNGDEVREDIVTWQTGADFLYLIFVREWDNLTLAQSGVRMNLSDSTTTEGQSIYLRVPQDDSDSATFKRFNF